MRGVRRAIGTSGLPGRVFAVHHGQSAHGTRSLAGRVLLYGLLALQGGCGGGGGGGTSPTPPVADNPNQVTISAAGVVTPSEIVVAPGSRVLFINNHSRAHLVASDPHPEHTDCPEINQVGLLAPGQRRETGNFVTARSCGFHDHDNPDNASLRGRIVIR